MTGLIMDGIDVLGPVSGRIGMGYYDCYCKLFDVTNVAHDPER
jgi:hypothetical protein